jgi:hypothetical protein
VDFGGVIFYQQNAHWVVTTSVLGCRASRVFHDGRSQFHLSTFTKRARAGNSANMAGPSHDFHEQDPGAGKAHDKGKAKAGTSHDQGRRDLPSTPPRVLAIPALPTKTNPVRAAAASACSARNVYPSHSGSMGVRYATPETLLEQYFLESFASDSTSCRRSQG